MQFSCTVAATPNERNNSPVSPAFPSRPAREHTPLTERPSRVAPPPSGVLDLLVRRFEVGYNPPNSDAGG
jgi:hypothetical protein